MTQLLLNPHDPIVSVYRPTFVSLDDTIAVQSANILGPVYWVCRRPPAEVLGSLLEEFTGVYLDHDYVARVDLPGRQAGHALPGVVKTWSPGRVNALLAVILQMELDGRSAAFISAAINDIINTQTLTEAA